MTNFETSSPRDASLEPIESLRVVRDELVKGVLEHHEPADQFPARFALAADRFLTNLLDKATGNRTRGYALVGVGGYGRSQLCPASDLDLLLIHRGRTHFHKVAEKIWYAIWDDGLKLDHSVRTRGEVISMARSDLKVVLGLLDARVVAGDERAVGAVLSDAPQIWTKQAITFLPELEASIASRHRSAGALAYLLEPDLKLSEGGLRDLGALRALSAAYPDLSQFAEAPEVLEGERMIVAARVALHCRTGSSSDRLLLQEQDEVAAILEFSDADALMAAMAASGRAIASNCREAWRRAREEYSPRRSAPAQSELTVDDGVILRNGEIALSSSARPAEDPAVILRLAVAAAQRNAPIARSTLDRIEIEHTSPVAPWSDELRQLFIALLGSGDALVPVVESLDQRRLFELFIPEWSAVRNRPQRNAYHRFTVDRHLLEAVARAAEHVGQVDRPDLLLLGALLHDIGKGSGGDHSEVGKHIAEVVARRMGYDDKDVATLVRVVAYHLLLPEVATRRDLEDPASATLVARLVEDRRTLMLLAALTEADSRATGMSAWGPWKAELVATLVERTAEVLDGRARPPAPRSEPTPEQQVLLSQGTLALIVSGKHLTVIAPDQPGLLAAVAGVLALHGCNVQRASAQPGSETMAIEVFDVESVFDQDPDWSAIERDVARALAGTLEISDRLAARDETYARGRRPLSASPPQEHVLIDNETSELASIVEVRALDRLGLLNDFARVFSSIGLDVVSAHIDTLGYEVIDSFYIRNGSGKKLEDSAELARVKALLENVIAAH